jgi:7-carboxy-7-deazaguanine synthase (Cx14CxxC type)
VYNPNKLYIHEHNGGNCLNILTDFYCIRSFCPLDRVLCLIFAAENCLRLAYKIKEIYYTLQGEGFHTGHAAVFCRFTGCNLWSGREEDRHKAICQFCDTDFVGTDGELGGKYSGEELVKQIRSLWPDDSTCFVVFTGGEPALQLDKELVDILHKENCYIAIETNGTIELPEGIDWVCMSPKAGTNLIVQSGNELKLVYPQVGLEPERFADWAFDYHFLQPMDCEEVEDYTSSAIRYIRANPKWKLSVQTHKVLGIQ